MMAWAAWAALSMSMPYRSVPATMITKTATTMVKRAPITVSNFPHGISFSFISLSTTALCWKKIIHGAMVVPMFAIRRKKSSP